MEVDERQVNLRRFSLFFPEKREFFPRGPRDIRLWLSRENLEKLCWNHLWHHEQRHPDDTSQDHGTAGLRRPENDPESDSQGQSGDV